jgi:hypothetical protein
MPQLTTNFKSEEFLTGSQASKWEELEAAIQEQILELAGLLQTIRVHVKKPIVINNSFRSKADYERLKKGGYNPSKTSDHFFAQNIDGYKLGLGAADIVCPDMDTVKFYNKILKLKYDGKIKCGQLLLEKNKTFWVHVANHWGSWLKGTERSDRSLNGNGYSLNNGNTFKWLKEGELAPTDLK